MRIFAAAPNYPPHSRVGAWLCTHDYLAHLAAEGHDVMVMPLTGNEAPYTIDGVQVIPFTIGRTLDEGVRNADIVVSHCGDNGAVARTAAKHHVPNVRMAHGRVEDIAALDGASLVVFNSHNLAASVECPSPWIVCHPPVDAVRFRTTPGDGVTLVNLSEAKGGELFWRLVRCAPHRQFLGVRGCYGNQYVDTARNAEVIETTANMRDQIYARTRILLMPSERETWGMTGVEALASGIPVIAHPTDGLVESLGSAGIFVDRADGQGWLDEIERLYDPTEWAAASALAVARSTELDPTEDLSRFAAALEQLHCTGVPA